MGRKLRFAVALASSLLLSTVIVFLIQPTSPSEPTFNGKTLTAWIGQSRTKDPKKHEEAAAAMRSMAPRALPYLLHLMRSRESKLARTLDAIMSKQSLLKLRFAKARGQHMNALQAVYVMGAAAEPAYGDFVKLLNDPNTASLGALALAALGEMRARDVLLTAMKSKNKGIQQGASFGWAALYPDPSAGRLIIHLDSPDYGELGLGIFQQKDCK